MVLHGNHTHFCSLDHNINHKASFYQLLFCTLRKVMSLFLAKSILCSTGALLAPLKMQLLKSALELKASASKHPYYATLGSCCSSCNSKRGKLVNHSHALLCVNLWIISDLPYFPYLPQEMTVKSLWLLYNRPASYWPLLGHWIPTLLNSSLFGPNKTWPSAAHWVKSLGWLDCLFLDSLLFWTSVQTCFYKAFRWWQLLRQLDSYNIAIECQAEIRSGALIILVTFYDWLLWKKSSFFFVV